MTSEKLEANRVTMLSMTGYGQFHRSIDDVDIAVEIKTINSRYLDVNTRLPRELSLLESDIRREVREKLSRGRVDVFIDVTVNRIYQYELNEALAAHYLSLQERALSLGVEGGLDISTLLQLPGVLVPHQVNYATEEILESILEGVRGSITKVIEVRSREGAELRKDMESRFEKLLGITAGLAELTDGAATYYREKLKRRITDLNLDRPLDENRLAQEVVYYAERADIAEELTRLRSHISQFQELMKSSEERVLGRRIDFICQEMGREMNTILSKSPLAVGGELALEGKTEIDKIREQVQNVQ